MVAPEHRRRRRDAAGKQKDGDQPPDGSQLTGQGQVPPPSRGAYRRRSPPTPTLRNTSAPGPPPCCPSAAPPTPIPAAGIAPGRPFAAPSPPPRRFLLCALALPRLGAGCPRPPARRTGAQGHLQDLVQCPPGPRLGGPALTPATSCKTEVRQVTAGFPAARGAGEARAPASPGVSELALLAADQSPHGLPLSPVAASPCSLLPAPRQPAWPATGLFLSTSGEVASLCLTGLMARSWSFIQASSFQDS